MQGETMLELYAEPPSREILFEVDLRPSEDFIHKGSREQPGIITLLGRRNRVLVGVPQVINVLSNWPKNESLAEEIEAFRSRWDFYSVRLACSFEPHRGCRFIWACMKIELIADRPRAESRLEAIAFDLFPREVAQKCRYRRSFKVAPSLKFAFAEVSAGAESEREVIRYEPEIVASGLLTATPSWTLSSSARWGQVGSRELFLLVKKPKDATVQARFTVGAEVNTQFGPVPVKRYREDDLVDKSYPLIP